MLEIFDFFSKKISQILKEELVDKPMEEINTLEEIRIRSNGNITSSSLSSFKELK